MAEQFWVLIKVFVLSALGSALIKYGVKYSFGEQTIAPSHLTALIAITLPSVVLGIIIWWRSQRSESVN